MAGDRAPLIIRPFELADTEAVIVLWQAAGLTRPWNDPRKDIDRKMTVQPELFLVGLVAGEVVVSAMGGYDGHRGSVYYLAVSPACQGQGHGQAIMRRLECRLIGLGCPKINLLIRGDNRSAAGFYQAIGYTEEDVASYGKRLIPDE